MTMDSSNMRIIEAAISDAQFIDAELIEESEDSSEQSIDINDNEQSVAIDLTEVNIAKPKPVPEPADDNVFLIKSKRRSDWPVG